MKVKIIDVGKCFGHDHWYMFHCGKCNKCIDMNKPKNNRLSCENCGEPIHYQTK